MSAAVIGVVLLILAAIGVGVYFMFFVKKECKEYETQADCKKPCKWDTYGGKCIGKDGDMTPAPPPPPPSCSSYATQDTCVSPCTWNVATGTCGSGSLQGVTPPSWDIVDGYPPTIANAAGQHVNGGSVSGDWFLVASGDAMDPEDCKKAAIKAGSNNWGWRKNDKSCWSYKDSTFLTTYDKNTATGKTDHIMGCTLEGMKIKDGCRPSYRDSNILKGYPVVNMPSGHQELGETGEQYTMEECSQMAKNIGKTNWGYRTYHHATAPFTCWTYNDSMDIKGFRGDNNNTTEVMGCVDPTKKLRDGCA